MDQLEEGEEKINGGWCDNSKYIRKDRLSSRGLEAHPRARSWRGRGLGWDIEEDGVDGGGSIIKDAANSEDSWKRVCQEWVTIITNFLWGWETFVVLFPRLLFMSSCDYIYHLLLVLAFPVHIASDWEVKGEVVWFHFYLCLILRNRSLKNAIYFIIYVISWLTFFPKMQRSLLMAIFPSCELF